MRRVTNDQTEQDQATRDMQQVAANVRAEIARAGMTLTDVARELDIPYSVFQRRTSGEVPLRVQELIELGRLLGVYPATFFTGITLNRASE